MRLVTRVITLLGIAGAVLFSPAAALAAPPALSSQPKKLQLYGKLIDIRQAGTLLQLGANGSDIASTGRIYFRPGNTPEDAFFDGLPAIAAQWLALNPGAKATSVDVLQAKANSAAGAAVYAEQKGSGYAAFFSGSVTITGNLSSSAPKTARLQGPDGSPLYLFAREAPQSRYEDFGTVVVRGGRAEVPLDPTFREVIEPAADYNVFLTAQDGAARVAVGERRVDRFTVLADRDVTVAYNIAGVRRGYSDVRFTLKDVSP